MAPVEASSQICRLAGPEAGGRLALEGGPADPGWGRAAATPVRQPPRLERATDTTAGRHLWKTRLCENESSLVKQEALQG